MAENTVFLLLTALIHNFYKTIIGKLDTKAFGLKETSRIKAVNHHLIEKLIEMNSGNEKGMPVFIEP